MDFIKFGTGGEQEGVGVMVHHFLGHFNDTFQQSGAALLQSYLREFNGTEKWLLISDYAFNDSNKINDVITFSLMPYFADFDTLSAVLGSMAPADLKKIRSVKPEYLDFLAKGPVFNISIKLDRDRRLLEDERAYHLEKAKLMIRQLQYWIKTTPTHKNNHKRLIKLFERFASLSKGAGANLRVLRDLEIVTSLTAFLLCEVTRFASVDKIGWFSDRDSLLTYKSNIIGDYAFEMVNLLYYVFCQNEDIDAEGKLVFGVPERSNKVWYDDLVRIPDLIAGTLADYDYVNNISTHEKFIPVIESLFLSEHRNVFFKIDFKPTLNASRMTWRRFPTD